jgi:hypothetical protein
MKSTKERKERRREHQQEKGRHRRHKGEKKGQKLHLFQNQMTDRVEASCLELRSSLIEEYKI